MIVYVNNESIGNDVWFDDLNISYYSGGVLEQNHYYPYGLTLSSTAAGTTEQPYKYNSKELEKKFGLEYYNYGARQYDPQRGQWTGIDVLAEKYYSISPFAYVANNPVKYIDPNGKEIKIAYFELGKTNPENRLTVTYQDGKLYNSDGTLYSGDNSYLLTTQGDLNYLVNEGGLAGEIVRHLDASANTHTIGNMDFHDNAIDIKNDKTYEYQNANRNVESNPKGSFTKYTAKDQKYGYDPESKKAALTNRDRKKGLAHELTHGFDRDIGKPHSKENKEAEGRAVSIENTVNPEEGKRYHHGGNTYTENELENYKNQIKDDLDKN